MSETAQKAERWTVLEEGPGKFAVVCGDNWVALCSSRLYAQNLCDTHNAALSKLEAERRAMKMFIEHVHALTAIAINGNQINAKGLQDEIDKFFAALTASAQT